jgi:SAM-dependent methyltransferase
VTTTRSFDDLVDEAATIPITAWDFSFLDGRAAEARPSWHYFDLVAERARRVRSMLDVDAGTAHMIHALPVRPPLTVAVEAYQPSLDVAGPRLREVGAKLVVANDDALPFAAQTFALVTSRHPVETHWDEVARVLEPDGTYFSQQVGPHSLRGLSEFLMGPLPDGSRRDPALAEEAAHRAGLVVHDLRSEQPVVVFFDIGAVVYFLRLVVWTVPGFTVDRYRDQLRALHDHIERVGSFTTNSSRFLIEAVKPR